MYFIDSARKAIVQIDAGGRQRVVYGGDGLMQPSALALTPDQAFLVIADRMNRYMWSFQIAADGSLINGQEFHRLEMSETAPFVGVEGLAVDTIGHIWATSSMGIQVCEQPGRCGQILNKPELGPTPISNIAFGGPERNWIYVTQGKKIFRRPVKRVGVVPWELVKPPQPGL
jgi:sugar lactone lactonase YvrE